MGKYCIGLVIKMAIENLAEVQEWIESNKESNEDIKSYLGSFINKDSVNDFLTNVDDGKSIMDSIGNKAVTAYQGKGQLKVIEKAVKEAKEEVRKELNPKETPEQKRIRELEEKLNKQERDSLAKELQIQKNSLFADKKYDINLSKFIGGDSIEEIEKQADELNTYVLSLIATGVEEKLKSGYKPPKNNGSAKTYTQEDLKNMTPEEINKKWDVISQNMSK